MRAFLWKGRCSSLTKNLSSTYLSSSSVLQGKYGKSMENIVLTQKQDIQIKGSEERTHIKVIYLHPSDVSRKMLKMHTAEMIDKLYVQKDEITT